MTIRSSVPDPGVRVGVMFDSRFHVLRLMISNTWLHLDAIYRRKVKVHNRKLCILPPDDNAVAKARSRLSLIR